MTARIEKTVFISYRRTDFPWALSIYQDLTHHNYDVFLDYKSIPSGDFEQAIIENIKSRAHFIVGNCSRKIWLKQERQDRRSHQAHQILKGVLAVAFSGVQDGG